MGRWFKFFLGSPKRFLWTLGGIGMIICMFNPDLPVIALTNLTNVIIKGLGPLLGLALTIVIVFAGIKMIFGKKR